MDEPTPIVVSPIADLTKHPPVPDGCPSMNVSEGRWFFSVSWADEKYDEHYLDEAYQYDDVYTVIGAMCFWWCCRSGNAALAQEWVNWVEGCGATLATVAEEG